MKKWEDLPPEMQIAEIRPYYEFLKKKRFSLLCKRMFDILASIFLMIILFPLFFILAIAIKIDSKGPVFFRQERVTQYGRRFRIHKFRTMCEDAEDLGLQLTVKNDFRITKLGECIRKYRLDELPQLIDIFRGSMTFVGVRPEVPKYVQAYTPKMRATLLLPAGVTNLASILYKDEARLLEGSNDIDKDYLEKVLPDKMHWNLKWLNEFSFKNDIKLLVMTVLAICGKQYGHNKETLSVL